MWHLVPITGFSCEFLGHTKSTQLHVCVHKALASINFVSLSSLRKSSHHQRERFLSLIRHQNSMVAIRRDREQILSQPHTFNFFSLQYSPFRVKVNLHGFPIGLFYNCAKLPKANPAGEFSVALGGQGSDTGTSGI